ncbi:MAG: general stress protein 26 [Cellvibrionaceae bacterium]|jgi:general stress protein 26
MLFTHAKGSCLRSRPMETVSINEAGEIFFFTSSDLEQIEQVTESNVSGVAHDQSTAWLDMLKTNYAAGTCSSTLES